MLHNDFYNPRVIGWVSEAQGVFKVTNTVDFAQTWGRMKSNRSEEMNYEKVGSPDRLCTMITLYRHVEGGLGQGNLKSTRKARWSPFLSLYFWHKAH